MGTTLTVAYLVWPDLFVMHVGDSRCYLCSGGRLRQLTTDHTIAQRLSDEGAMDAALTAQSPFAHVLWNSISNVAKSELKPQVLHARLKPADVLMLCTDGLVRHVDDARILRTIGGTGTAQLKARSLVDMARAGGGADNITVVVSQRPPARDA